MSYRNLGYITADVVGIESGGGKVTHHEKEALISTGPTKVWDRNRLALFPDSLFRAGGDPWGWDNLAKRELLADSVGFDLCHIYAGTFSETVKLLKDHGCAVSYTAAAHDKDKSRNEHERLGVPFQYPHLTDPELWQRYLQGYLDADVLICPSKHSADVMRSYGAKNRIEVIPHGCDLPHNLEKPPEQFTVGYMGAYGPDKGVDYLIKAWNHLHFPLVLAGRDSLRMLDIYPQLNKNGKNVKVLGWVNNVADFYNQISCLCQCSCSEGFGLEVLEAFAHGRPVVCSTGAGAVDLVPKGWEFEACNVDQLCSKIQMAKGFCETYGKAERWPSLWQEKAKPYTWNLVKDRYVNLWKSLL